YLRFGSWSDLQRAADLHRRAIARFDEGSAERSMCLNNLSLVLLASYEHTGELGYLEDAVAAARDAVGDGRLVFQGSPTCLNTLMIALLAFYQHNSDLLDLNLAIEIGRDLVSITTDGPARGMYLHNLGNALVDRYDATEDPSDLQGAIDAHERALSHVPDGSTTHAEYLDDWATSILR